MHRKLVKAAALVAVVGLTFYLCRSNTLVACIAASYMTLHSIISLDRGKALKGDSEKPGLLMISTFSLSVAGVVFLVGIPYFFNQIGYNDSWTFDWVYVVSAFLTGLVLAAYLWIPFVLYALIDLVHSRFTDQYADAPAS